MMKRLIIPVIFLALFFIPVYTVKAAPDILKKEYKINEEFNEVRFEHKTKNFIIDCKKEDVNNDNILDDILLTGYKEQGVYGQWSEDINIAIIDGKNKYINIFSIGEANSGCGGRLFIGDFNGDKLADVFSVVHTESDLQTSLYSLISFNKDKSIPIFNQKSFAVGPEFEISFIDYFRVSIFSKEFSKFFSLDVKNKKYSYVECGIYDKRGKVIQATKGSCSGFEELTPLDVDKDGVFELKGVQRISGVTNKDTLGFVKSIWKFNNEEMKLESLEVISYAKPGKLKKVQRVIPVFVDTEDTETMEIN